ncbi:postacrosomal sheath WW domain-binding protein isoform X1 [Zalophus californianus]|uniref:Postacrosomal sheath WW domain-binding protein isoform X1 n=1 Tax=Zalophus californianus TaxID=9704 RepID=A0A6J2D6D8_ZALCA|nr:postacrosomal sheath WW domain-binding protein isoform X1 [Zalophus californianus]XP_027450405.2 postacrosomal sheath WW domain-binding protein isoform X1 [Zalophus californianus]XP_027450406.2 postacrosomal sheath WW domain-binding protein isoform X1 [Zalophus californianus]XP_027450407.2 postacrosomal sheath WW domain-binding protein isoform X1 [Zalophus californianus]XP_027450408.2 postacrosomal sheath WW domain-binding protein isoform X1 [Zalophus californianus]XP_027450409.2 postacroso
MAVNQSHTENRRGAIIPFGESVLTQCQDVELSFLQQPEGSSLFSGTKRGTLFLTSYRVIFVTSHTVNDSMFSFMMPFHLMSNCTIEQPVFTSNFIKGIIQAAPDGGWEGQATFKLAFRKGGAIEFAQLMMKAASAAARGVPLGSVNYWFSTPGLYVFTGQGGMMCSQQMPCPAYPFVVYGPPQAGYRTPQVGYGHLQAGYGPSPGVCGTPQVGYRPPQAGYGSPPVGYRPPPGVCGTPPAGYGPLPAGNETPPAANEAPPPGYEVPPAGNGAGSSRFMAAQPAGHEPSLPPASSSEAQPPSFRK